MKQQNTSSNPTRKEDTKLEVYKIAINDARYIFNQYKDTYPAEAWETLRKIIFNPNLK